jgi:hypothetical protein
MTAKLMSLYIVVTNSIENCRVCIKPTNLNAGSSEWHHRSGGHKAAVTSQPM